MAQAADSTSREIPREIMQSLMASFAMELIGDELAISVNLTQICERASEKCRIFLGGRVALHVTKPRLHETELEICQRLRHARECVVKISQTACAREMDLDRARMANYETGRTPLRFEIAMQFCRQFVISEEWLATGRHDALHAALPASVANSGDWKMFDEKISVRMCMDLFSDPIRLHIRPGTLFSKAFRDVLEDRYRLLVVDSPFYPRIVFSDADNWGIAINLLRALHERHFNFLEEIGKLPEVNTSGLWRLYTSRLVECSVLAFGSVQGKTLQPALLEKLRWLRDVFLEPSFGGCAVSRPTEQMGGLENSGKELTGYPHMGKTGAVKPILPRLIERLQRATKQRGRKTELAAWLGVSPQKVTDWLSQRVEPSGETTLRLLHWVEQQERQTK